MDAVMDLTELRDAEEEARVRIDINVGGMASPVPSVRDRHADDWTASLDAYREAIERRVRAEQEEAQRPIRTSPTDTNSADSYTIADSFSAGRFPQPPAGAAS